MVKFAAICPHPPLLLPGVGSDEDKLQVKKTIKALGLLAKRFKKAEPDEIVISSPHEDWGFNVPLHFLAHRSLAAPLRSLERRWGEGGLAKGFKGAVKPYLTGPEPPSFYFEEGKKYFQKLSKDKVYALIASGDLSHCLKEDGPYGFNPDGPKFDRALIEKLKQKDIKTILRLDDMFPEAGECGLRPICFVLGILEASGINWQPEVLSYEAPFGVGYLIVNFKL